MSGQLLACLVPIGTVEGEGQSKDMREARRETEADPETRWPRAHPSARQGSLLFPWIQGCPRKGMDLRPHDITLSPRATLAARC